MARKPLCNPGKVVYLTGFTIKIGKVCYSGNLPHKCTSDNPLVRGPSQQAKVIHYVFFYFQKTLKQLDLIDPRKSKILSGFVISAENSGCLCLFAERVYLVLFAVPGHLLWLPDSLSLGHGGSVTFIKDIVVVTDPQSTDN